jgi:hypothetical protein
MSQMLNTGVRWTTQDVELLPEKEGTRYEILESVKAKRVASLCLRKLVTVWDFSF